MNRDHDRPGARRGRSLLAWLALAATAAPGCGSSGPEMGRVSGTVTYNGKPVPKGTIAFKPVATDGRNATGVLDASGRYSLTTEQPNDGAIVGNYVVTVSAHDEPILDYIPQKPVKPKLLAPAKYENPAKTDLKAEVRGGSNTFDFTLKD